MELSDTVRDVINDAIDVHIGTSAEVRFFTATPSTGTELAAILLNTTNAFNASATGVMAINTSTTLEDTSPAAAGTCTRLAFYTGTGVANASWSLNCSVAATGSPDVDMSNTTIATTDTVQLTSFSITCPAGSPA
jgi:UDP-3-O-acyl-N-acetylglucosamine deacetylase